MDQEERLRPYVTGLAVAWAHATPDARHRAIEGSLAFVDISGFTTLTERLAAKGKIGAEEMSDVLNEKFAELLEVAYSYGALLVKWGGDAVLLLFEGPDHAALACRAAHEMQRTMRRIGKLHTSVGAVQLRMSVGINSGTFDFFLVGDRHLELLVAGPGATETAVMEGIAEAGQVLVSRATAAQLPSRCLGEPKEGGVLLRTGPPVDPRCRYWPRYEESVGPSRFLDPAIRDHLRVEVGDCEHRQVAIGFVEISGLDDLLQRQGPGAAAGALHDLIRVVQQACEHHRVTFWETDISKDGFKILLIAGAPRSSGHDEDAMLRAAHAIVDGYSGPVRVRIGVNTGRVFNGAFGPAFRRTWSVKGDAVNLAARVMAKAETGQLLATETLLRRVASRVDADLLPPFTVKGKKHLVHAAVVQRVSSDRVVDTASASAFVGRRAEMDLLLQAARSADGGNGCGVVIVGEPGVGKSRLADHVVNRIGEPVTVLRGFGEDYESTTAYYAVRRVLRAAIGHAIDAPDAAVAEELLRQVRARCPALEPWLPLLAVPFDVDLPDTAETGAVHEEFRRPRTMALIVEFLGAVLTGPTVFLVDDVHVADDLSVEVMNRISMHAVARRWLVLLVGRQAPAALSANETMRTLEVPPLSDDDARTLVLDTPGAQLLAPHVIRGVVDRGEGNPLFLRELAMAVSAADGEELPSSLEDLLAAQIDDLAPDARKLLRSVSVLGSRFDESLAADLVGGSVAEEHWSALDHFLARHADGSRRFRTKLARDAAYEGLPFTRRVDLHGRVVTLLAQRATDADDYAEPLSLHCLAAQRYDEARRYSLIAGGRARRLYANREALTFFLKALAAAKKVVSVSPTELAQLLLTIGELHDRLAELDDAVAAYEEARRRAPRGDRVLRARTALGAGLAVERGQPSRSARWFTAAERDLSAASDDDERRVSDELRARIAVERAFLRYRQGRHRESARLCEQALGVAGRVGENLVVARSLLVADMNRVALGQPTNEEDLRKALGLFREMGQISHEAMVQNQMGIHAYYAGDWNRAAECYQEARRLRSRAGDDWGAAVCSANAAEILIDQGHLDDAEPITSEALRVWRSFGTPGDVAFGAALMARLCSARGHFAEAMEYLSEAINCHVASGERLDLVETELLVSEVLIMQGAAPAALQRIADCELTLQQLLGPIRGTTEVPHKEDEPLSSGVPQFARISRLRGFIAGQLGRDDEAKLDFNRSLAVARSRGATYDTALALHGLAWLSSDNDAELERTELLGRLGVVWLPTPPRRAADRPSAVPPDVPRQRSRSAALT